MPQLNGGAPVVLMQRDTLGPMVAHPTLAGVHIRRMSTLDGSCSRACLSILKHLNVQHLAETKYHLVYCNKCIEGYCKQNSNLKLAMLTEHCMPKVSLAVS